MYTVHYFCNKPSALYDKPDTTLFIWKASYTALPHNGVLHGHIGIALQNNEPMSCTCTAVIIVVSNYG